MELETWKKTLEVWIHQNREIGENVRFHEVIESLKVNKEVIGLAEYVATYVLPVLDTVEKQTVQQIMDKLEDYWFKMERMYSRMEEKKVEKREWFSVWMMMQTEKRKGMEKFELQDLRNIVKQGGQEVMPDLRKKFREMKVESNRGKVTDSYYMGHESIPRQRYQEQRRRESQGRDWERTRRFARKRLLPGKKRKE